MRRGIFISDNNLTKENLLSEALSEPLIREVIEPCVNDWRCGLELLESGDRVRINLRKLRIDVVIDAKEIVARRARGVGATCGPLKRQ